jgi:hypothetical protein
MHRYCSSPPPPVRAHRFHGSGSLTFPNGARFVADWHEGALVSGMYYFDDELEYLPRGWQYCTDADRRFWSEQQYGIQFAEYPQLTDSGEQDTAAIPYGTYDMGDCYLEPNTNKLFNYDVSARRRRVMEEGGDASGIRISAHVRGASGVHLQYRVLQADLSGAHRRISVSHIDVSSSGRTLDSARMHMPMRVRLHHALHSMRLLTHRCLLSCMSCCRPLSAGHILSRSDARGAHMGEAESATRTR